MTEKQKMDKAARQRRKMEAAVVHGVIWIMVAALAAFVLGTLFIAFFTSLKQPEETISAAFEFFPKHWRWQNYIDVLKGDIWARYFFNSAFVTVVVVGLSIVISSLAGYAFARLEFKGSHVLFILFLCGMMLPSQVYIIPQYILLKQIPLMGGNNIWGKGGLGLLNTYWALIIPYLSAPLGVFLIKQYYMGFPKALDEAATLDGCGSFDVYRYIFLPLSKPVFATFAILKFTGTWNDYFYPLIMTNSKSMYNVQIALQKYQGEFGVQWNYLMAAATMSIAPILIVFIFCQKYFTQGIVTSGLK
ncbi:carbohydrate ABC transporter permease [Clostridiales bacterium TF09-2AC]|uniref:Carbohydrate ABC transporter permease n=1 Tax=Enterocloster hominis (ex Hitch et al. 2024) TaxID=1917870 RepID=A0ABV1D9U7_9FIRM|nr:carbohydrate ABC transporter permease [Clostridiales bacterium TF09-2AC]